MVFRIKINGGNMEKKFKLGVIGAGFMASAIIKGTIGANVLNPKDIIVSDPNKSLLDKMSENGVTTTTNNKDVVNNSEFVLFAVKPQSLNTVLEDIKSCCCDKFISIMAGVKKEKIKNVFSNALVARCMPNTPCAIGCGAIGLDLSDFTCESDKKFIVDLLSSLAVVVQVEENMLNAVTGISGSAPAYFYLFLESVVNAGVKQGLDYESAKSLAVATMIGAGKMVQAMPDKSIGELINAVCSKGGTTIEAVKVFNENKLKQITETAVDACVTRSIELEKL